MLHRGCATVLDVTESFEPELSPFGFQPTDHTSLPQSGPGRAPLPLPLRFSHSRRQEEQSDSVETLHCSFSMSSHPPTISWGGAGVETNLVRDQAPGCRHSMEKKWRVQPPKTDHRSDRRNIRSLWLPELHPPGGERTQQEPGNHPQRQKRPKHQLSEQLNRQTSDV